jgi:hypothetical protein
MNNHSKYFFCYDRNLSKYLVKKGHKYITRARCLKTNHEFALFEKTDDLKMILERWKDRKVII